MKLTIPYFKQERNTTCGVASVRMVLAFHGKTISESELADVCDTSWLGNTPGELVVGIDKLGFNATEIEGITIEYLSQALQDADPIIALIDPAVLYGGIEGFGHYVVIIGIENDNIIFHDPDMDSDQVRASFDFFKSWRGFSMKGIRIWKSMKK